jgi:hypothetical protein
LLLLLHLDHTRNKIGCRTKHVTTFNYPSPSSHVIYTNKLNLLHLIAKTTKLSLHTKFESRFGLERLGCMCVHHLHTSTKISSSCQHHNQDQDHPLLPLQKHNLKIIPPKTKAMNYYKDLIAKNNLIVEQQMSLLFTCDLYPATSPSTLPPFPKQVWT